ncbi:outer membrane beta-barrel protein [Bdellovibrio sp. HCB337]|uniref:outer membrane beta-barrel protein n=1 Tax=Bdellovibrio sp. HCB337 TaxID=3394358 RepID=UPI0039A3FE6F
MKKFFAIYVVLMALTIQYAEAGMLVEPYLGYDQSSMEVVTVGNVDASATNSGLDYGARAGYRFSQGMWLSAEYALGNGSVKPKDSAQEDATYTKSAMSAVVGYDHDKFRLWLGYGVSDKLTFKDSTGTTNLSGTNYKLGFGFKPAAQFSVNLEYLVPSYTKFNNGGADADVSTAFSKLNGASTQLSLSMPFDLGK